MSPNPRAEIAEIFHEIAAPIIADRPAAPLRAKGGAARLLKTDGGRTVTHGEVVAGLLARAEIETQVVDGHLPEWVSCEGCRVPVKVAQNSKRIVSKCAKCSGAACQKCGGKKAKRYGPGLCRACSKAAGTWTKANKKRAAGMSAEQRKQIMSHAAKCVSKESRSAKSKNIMAKRSPEEKKRIAELGGQASGNLSSEQLSERIRKGWIGRRAKKAASVAP